LRPGCDAGTDRTRTGQDLAIRKLRFIKGNQ
jgi:hypothetical protein